MLEKYLDRIAPAGRLEYAALCVLFCGFVLGEAQSLADAVLGYVHAVPPRYMELALLALSLFGLVLIFVLASLMLVLHSWRRLLDLGEPPRRAWLVLIPLYNLYFMGRLMARPGATPPPSHGGKTADRTRWRAMWYVVLMLGVLLCVITPLLRFVSTILFRGVLQ